MSMEDCVLYRKIDKDWYIVPYAFTWQDDVSDEEFKVIAFKVPGYVNVFKALERLNSVIETEHEVQYAGDYQSDAPKEVPREHRLLLMPDDQRRSDD